MAPERSQDENITRGKEINLRAMCGVQGIDEKRAEGLMVMLILNETIDCFTKTECVGMVMCCGGRTEKGIRL